MSSQTTEKAFESYVETMLRTTAGWQAGDLAEPAAGVASFFMRYPDQLNDWFFNAYDVLSGKMEPEAEACPPLGRLRSPRER